VPSHPPNHQIFVGIDIGYRTHVACACPGAPFNTKRYPDGWKNAKTLRLTSDEAGFRKLKRYLEKLSRNHADFLILCEPTGGYYGLGLQMFLLERGYTLLQVDNAALAAYREKVYGADTKTDAMDARLLARMGFLNEWVGEEFSIQAVHLRDPDEAVLRLMVRDHIKLGKEINRRQSQLHQMLSATFPELKSFFKSSVTGSAGRNLLKKYPTPNELTKASVSEIARLLHESKVYRHARHADELLRLAQGSAGLPLVSHHLWRQEWIIHQLDILEDAQTALDTQIAQVVATHPYTPVIESLPVRSPIWTATLIGVIGNIDRFHNYRQFRSYVGWFPRIKQSGTSVDTSRLAPDGVRLGRHVFGLMAMMLMVPTIRETPFRISYQRLLARGMKPSTAIGNIAGKLASVLYSCLKTRTPYDEMRHRKELGLQTDEDAARRPTTEIPSSTPEDPSAELPHSF